MWQRFVDWLTCWDKLLPCERTIVFSQMSAERWVAYDRELIVNLVKSFNKQVIELSKQGVNFRNTDLAVELRLLTRKV